MKINPFIWRFLVLLLFSFCYRVTAAQQFSDISKYKDWQYYKQLQELYSLSGNHLLWVNNKDARSYLIKQFERSAELALDINDYETAFIKSYNDGERLRTFADSLDADVHFTESAIHFFTEVGIGSAGPHFSYDGLKYEPVVADLPMRLNEHLREKSLDKLVNELQPKCKEYISAHQKLNALQKMTAAASFKEVNLSSNAVDPANKQLVIKLYQLGFIDSANQLLNKKELVLKVKAAQKQFDLFNDGVLRSTSIEAFNVPLRKRIEQLALLINNLRWLEPLKQHNSALLLNIPSADFFLYENGSITLDSKVIVGKPSTPTPTLTSTITEVILYPYWNVPQNIATRELLPNIRRNIGYLEAGNFQVINREGRILNPYMINWHALSESYFPYIIRQCTGCDNSLGIVKFNFYNPFTVYLHDTPAKALFNFSKRYFSHGCMRVEKPVELARTLLGYNRIAIDTLTAKGCVKQQAPVIVPAQKKMPVLIMYSTAWYTKEGEVRFYENVYGKLGY
jgi:L,D-transpeptidase YcbB